MAFDGNLINAALGAQNRALHMSAVTEGQSILVLMTITAGTHIPQAIDAACRAVGFSS